MKKHALNILHGYGVFNFWNFPINLFARRMRGKGMELDGECDLNSCFVCGMWAFTKMNSNQPTPISGAHSCQVEQILVVISQGNKNGYENCILVHNLHYQH